PGGRRGAGRPVEAGRGAGAAAPAGRGARHLRPTRPDLSRHACRCPSAGTPVDAFEGPLMRIPLVVAVLCLAAPVGAQTPPPPPPPDQSPSETEGKPVQELPQEETTPPAATKKTAPAKSETGAAPELPGTTHTVVPGDTLWDLSQHYLGSPWYWPKVWSYNPQIANPHWIYPGNQVRFFTGTGEEPAGEVESIEPGTGTQGEGDIAVLEQVEDNTVSMVGPKPYEPQGHERLPRE